MLKIALTGGIATGKSYVLDQLRRRGVPCLDSDAIVHEVTAAGTQATAAIVARFGPSVCTPDGGIDRKKLGAIVFADPDARQDLETIVHPAVYRAVALGLRDLERSGLHQAAVVDVPLLFETDHQSDFDKVIVTACGLDVQLARLRARGMADADARQRVEAQWPTEQKVAGAHFVIRTGGSFEDTDRQVEQVYQALRQSAEKT